LIFWTAAWGVGLRRTHCGAEANDYSCADRKACRRHAFPPDGSPNGLRI